MLDQKTAELWNRPLQALDELIQRARDIVNDEDGRDKLFDFILAIAETKKSDESE